jgi:lipopolysaccharide export system permease protein
MKSYILQRYILREHLGPFFFGFSVITLIFLLNLLFRELSRILSKGLAWHVVLEFFALNMAWIIALAVPMAVLIATLMAFGRLAADNEITAIKASGISLYHAITPVLLAAAVVATGMIWFNNEVLPDFNHRARLLAGDIARKQPGVAIEPGVWYDRIPNYGLLIQHLEDSVKTNGTVWRERTGVTIAHNMLIEDHSDPDRIRMISARRGYIEIDPRLGALVMQLFNGEMQELDIRQPEEVRRITFPKHVLSVGVDEMFLRRSESEYRGDREKSAPQMRLEVKATQRQIKENIRQINEHVARDLYRWFGGTFGVAGGAMDSILAQTPFYPLAYIAQYDPANLSRGSQGMPVASAPDDLTLRSASARPPARVEVRRNPDAKDLTQPRRQRLSNLLSHERQILYNLDI